MNHPALTPLYQQTFHALDPRPPQAVQAVLERATDVVFTPLAEGGDAARSAALPVGQVQVRLTLALLAVLPRGQHYRLTVEVGTSWDGLDVAAQRRSVDAWLALWTDGLTLCPAPFAGADSPARHQALLAAWAADETQLNDVAATQQAVLQSLRDGKVLRTSHKEGGTTMRFTGRRFLRVDHGDCPAERGFDSDADFLAFLRQFYDYETSRHVWPAHVPEAAVWRLVYRRLDPVDSTAPATRRGRGGQTVLTVVLGGLLAGGLAWWKVHPKAEALRSREAVLSMVPPASANNGQPPARDWQRLLDEQRRAVEAAQLASR